jgi:hypothetical protein
MDQDRARVIDDRPEKGFARLPTHEVGTKVCVRNQFLGNWSSGFAVAEVVHHGYRIRRLSDGLVFPDVFAVDDVRPERRQEPERGIVGSHLDRRP